MALLNLTSGFGQRAFSFLFGTSPLSTGNPTPVLPTLIGGMAVYPDPNTKNYIQLGFCGNGSIYTIISVPARRFGSLPRYVYKIEDKQAAAQYKAMLREKKPDIKKIIGLRKKAYDEKQVDSPLTALLNRPNDNESQDVFFEKSGIFYLAAGENYIYLNRGIKTTSEGLLFYNDNLIDDDDADKIPPLFMDVLPAQFVELIPDPTDVFGLRGYWFNINGQRKFIRKNDIIAWKKPNPDFDANTRIHMRGLSPMKAANKLITQDDSATDASVSMFQSGGARGALFNESFDNLTPTQRDQVEGVINNKVNNRDKKSSIAALQGKWGYLPFGSSSVDMELTESQEKIFVRLCNVWGVNPMLFLANATYENIKQAGKDLLTNLLLPMSASLNGELDRQLLPAFGLGGGSYTIDVDISSITELQDDMQSLVASAAAATWKSVDEKRKMTNDEEIGGDEGAAILVPNNLISLSDAILSDNLNSYSDDDSGESGATGGGKISYLPEAGGKPSKRLQGNASN